MAASSVNKHRKSASSATRGASTAKAPAEENVYTIDKIMEYLEDPKQGPRWRIRWTNYTADDDTWEPAENIMTDDKKVHADMDRLQKEFREKKAAAAVASPKGGSRKSAASPKKKDDGVVKVRGKQRKSTGGGTHPESAGRPKMRVAHIRRYPDRDDDFQCVLVGSEGDTQILPVSEARGKYYNELIDYLLKRVKFLENTNN